jgi:hypothetical protein
MIRLLTAKPMRQSRGPSLHQAAQLASFKGEPPRAALTADSQAAAGERIFVVGDRRPKTCLKDEIYAQRHKSRPHVREKPAENRPFRRQVFHGEFRWTGRWVHHGSNLGPADLIRPRGSSACACCVASAASQVALISSTGTRIHNPVHGRMHPVLHFDPMLRPSRLIRPLTVLRD